MDDDNDVCPLCCEELDMSDQQFFPCKCGYQVCMWCWHRIRESESGLCPACRTPYGDDPHEFSAVDVEDVLKANKEKAAAEKREKERLRQQQGSGSMSNAVSMGYGNVVGNMHISGGSDGDQALSMGTASSGGRGPMEAPKDRNQLANMRVIRRNLVYAVGLPPSIATEETLRKPEYFGQYGKIAKIVLNRNHNGNGDPRRASSSAYVTFQHKEDTLACILALDGFYLDGRNVRASYGTSKYCSAFIKNVRCNNPECTYLHCMGDAEDTFTKQEIQAGYVTSGRDVLARQQQIAAQVAAASALPGSRRRVGGGGPSGTGKSCSSPVFPAPSYDEPPKASSSTLLSAGLRSTSSSGFSAVAATGTSSAPSSVKVSRSTSMPAPSVSAASQSHVAIGSAPTSGKGIIGSVATGTMPQPSSVVQRASSIGSKSPTVSGLSDPLSAGSISGGATIASVVAGSHLSTGTSQVTGPAPHTTLTPLIPLKRATTAPAPKASGASGKVSSGDIVGSGAVVESVQLPPNMPVPKEFTQAERDALLEQRREAMAAMARQQREMAMKLSALRNGTSVVPKQGQALGPAIGTASTSPSSSVSSASGAEVGVGTIGGTVIGGAGPFFVGNGIGGPASGFPVGPASSHVGGSGAIGAIGSGSSLVGSRVFGGSAPLAFGSIGTNTRGSSFIGGNTGGTIGSGASNNSSLGGSLLPGQAAGRNPGLYDGWGAPAPNGAPVGLFNGESALAPKDGIWGNDAPVDPSGVGGARLGSHGVTAIGDGVVRSNHSSLQSGTMENSSGSSTLASMLGIALPTGSGSLRESSSVLGTSDPVLTSTGSHGSAPGVIGPVKKNALPVGGLAIGGPNFGSSRFPPNRSTGPGAIGSGGSSSDVALLQSLLPGVHITSGNAEQPAAPRPLSGMVGNGWNAGQSSDGTGTAMLGGLSRDAPPKASDGTWGVSALNSGGSRAGMNPAVGQQANQQQSSIW